MTTFPSLGLLAVAGLLSIVHVSGPALGESAPETASVIELYTSQGCSSCRSADEILKTLAERPDVIPLSFPVTYWDYLGWKDTLARPENSDRQRSYAKIIGEGKIYTPQAIVNGMQDCLGNSLAEIEAAVRDTGAIVEKEAVPLKVSLKANRLIIETGGAPKGSQHQKGKVWVASVRRSLTVPIARGENAGSSVTYTNVVRNLTEAGDWAGAPTSYSLPVNAKLSKDGDMLVVFLQTDDLGPIVAATRVAGGS